MAADQEMISHPKGGRTTKPPGAAPVGAGRSSEDVVKNERVFYRGLLVLEDQVERAGAPLPPIKPDPQREQSKE